MEPVPTTELKPKKKPEARADRRPQSTTRSWALPYLSVEACSLAKERTCGAFVRYSQMPLQQSRNDD